MDDQSPKKHNIRRNYSKGRYAEYRLMNRMMRRGYICYRAPASGSKAKRIPYADIFCVKKCGDACKMVAFEVKYFEWWHTVFISEYQYDSLKRIVDMGGEAYVAIKIGTDDFRFVPLDKLQPFEAKSEKRRFYKWKIERDTYLEGLSFEEIARCPGESLQDFKTEKSKDGTENAED